MANQNENKNLSGIDKLIGGKSLFTKIVAVVAFAIILCWVLVNLSPIAKICGRILSLFKPIVYGFCIAYFINIFMLPLEKLWDKFFAKRKIRFALKRAVCLILSLILVAGILFTVLFLIIPELTKTIYELVNALPGYLENLEIFFKENFNAFNIKLPEFKINAQKLQEELGKILPKISSDFVNTTVDVTSSIISAVVTLLLSFVFALYMLVQKEQLCLTLKKLLYAVVSKKTAGTVLFYLDLTNNTFSRFVTGQLTEALIIGTLCFAGMLILQIPYALITSVLISFTALIPVFGAFFGTFIGAFLIIMVSPVKALWFVIFIIVLQQVEGNLIYPRVVGKSVGLPGILVLTAVTIGGNAFGIVGMMLGVPLVSVLYFITNQFINSQLEKKKIKIN